MAYFYLKSTSIYVNGLIACQLFYKFKNTENSYYKSHFGNEHKRFNIMISSSLFL